jgi:hypothetical protein
MMMATSLFTINLTPKAQIATKTETKVSATALNFPRARTAKERSALEFLSQFLATFFEIKIKGKKSEVNEKN